MGHDAFMGFVLYNTVAGQEFGPLHQDLFQAIIALDDYVDDQAPTFATLWGCTIDQAAIRIRQAISILDVETNELVGKPIEPAVHQ